MWNQAQLPSLSKISLVVREWQDTSVGTWVVPLGLAVVGSFGVVLVTAWLRYFIFRQRERALANQNLATEKANYWQKYMVKRGDAVLFSLNWIRWFGVAVLFLYAGSMLVTNIIDFLEEVPGIRSKSGLPANLKRLAHWMGWTSTALAKVLLIIMSAFWFAKFLEDALRVVLVRTSRPDELSRGRLRIETLESVSSYVIQTVVCVLGLLMLLQTLGLNVAPLVATAGVASVAIGFGAQSLVRDVLAGFFILLEDQFAVGDVIRVDGKEGLVESLSLRVTRLRGTNGSLFIVPNGEIKSVQNMTSEWSRVDFSIGVAYNTDFKKALAILEEEALNLRRDMPDDVIGTPEILGIDKFGESAVVLRLLIKTRPVRQWIVEREFNQRILERFIREQIEIPYPQRDVNIRQYISSTEKTQSL